MLTKNHRSVDEYAKTIHAFCLQHGDEQIVAKYSRYFKGAFDGYGIDQKTFEKQRDEWVATWKDELSLKDVLNLGDELMQYGKYEEKSFAIALLQSRRNQYSIPTFDRIGRWFALGVDNWAITDVLCMMVLSSFLMDEIISLKKLAEWQTAPSEWQRRAVPVTLVELLKEGLTTKEALPMVEPLMLDESEYVQKGIGTLLRGLWKKEPREVEDFLMIWKDRCGRLIVQYATEKMDKEYRKKFRKSKVGK